jgi:diadenylate cyclase
MTGVMTHMMIRWPELPPLGKNIGAMILEILIIFAVLYLIFRMMRGTRGAGVVKGLMIAVVVAFSTIYIAATVFQLEAITFMLRYFVVWSVIAAVVIFQPEIRRGLTRLGGVRLHMRGGSETARTMREVTNAALSLAERKVGALIAIERNVGLNNYADGGVAVDAEVSAPLIETIFYEGTRLHDGAVIIQHGRISAAGCFLPLSESELKHSFGTRHRAALGLSEETDALVLVVSEQTGAIRIAFDGRLTGALNPDNLLATLENMFTQSMRKSVRPLQRPQDEDTAN